VKIVNEVVSNNDTTTTEIYTLSLLVALPIWKHPLQMLCRKIT